MRKNAMRRAFTMVEMMIVVAIMGLLLAIAVPHLRNAREGAAAKACQGNLREVLSAKERWAMAENRASTDTPAESDLMPYYTRSRPLCPAGGTYTLGNLNTLPTCSVGGTRGEFNAHVMP